MLYETLVGEPPYTGPNAQAVLGRIITGEAVSAAKHRASVPANVDAAIRKALEELPADRFATAGELGRALGNPAFRYGEREGAAALASRGIWNPVSVGATALAVLFAASTLWFASRAGGNASDTPREVTRLTLSPPPGVSLNTGAGFDISPDGRTLVFNGGGQLLRRNLGGLEATPIGGPVGLAWMPFFSPDGEWVAFFDYGDNTLKRVRLDGTDVQVIADAPSTTRSGGWREDGTIVFNSSSLGGLMRVTTGGEVEPVGDGVGLGWQDMLPGGEFAIGTAGSQNEPQVALVRVATGETETLFPGMTPRYATGHIVFWRNGALWAVPFDVELGTVTGDPISIVQGVAGGSNDYAPQATVSPNGRFIAYQSTEAGYPEIFVRSYPDLVGPRMVSTLDIAAQTSATNADPREARAPVWGPDGTELLYQSGPAVVSVPVSIQGAFTNGVPQVAFTGSSWPFVDEGRHYDIHRDGSRILRIRTEANATGFTSPSDLVVIQNWQELLRGEGSGR